MIMHRTNADWEAGAVPDDKLLARVGSLIERLATAGILEGAEGLRPSSEGVRLVCSTDTRSIVPGPLDGTDDLPAGFTIVRAPSIDEAVEWATRQQDIFGDGEIDVRPVTEPWDIGLSEAPADFVTRRYMILRKATPSTEAGDTPTPSQRVALARLIAEASSLGVHVTSETMRPTRKGRRYKNSRDGVTVSDGPFTETKELIGGYVIVAAASLEEADEWAREYMRLVHADEVELRELE
jgi:hypothetical protein